MAGVNQYSALTKRRYPGLDYESMVRAKANILPSLYGLKDSEEAAEDELALNEDQFNKNYDLAQEQLANEKIAAMSQSQTMSDLVSNMEADKATSMGTGLLSTGVSAYSSYKTGQLVKDLIAGKASSATGIGDVGGAAGTDALANVTSKLPSEVPADYFGVKGFDPAPWARDIPGKVANLTDSVGPNIDALTGKSSPFGTGSIPDSQLPGYNITNALTPEDVISTEGPTLSPSVEPSATPVPEVGADIPVDMAVSSEAGVTEGIAEGASEGSSAAGSVTGTMGNALFWYAVGKAVHDYVGEPLERSDNWTVSKVGTAVKDAAPFSVLGVPTKVSSDNEKYHSILQAVEPVSAGGVLGRGLREGLSRAMEGNLTDALETIGKNSPHAAMMNAIGINVDSSNDAVRFLVSPSAYITNWVSSLFCFAAGTMVQMSDGTKKPIEQLHIGDSTELGGKVIGRGEVLESNIYEYCGLHVEGNHAVFEKGKWLRVKNSDQAVEVCLDEPIVVYPIITENHLLFINGVVFADLCETDDGMSVTDDERLQTLNLLSRKNKFLEKYLEDRGL